MPIQQTVKVGNDTVAKIAVSDRHLYSYQRVDRDPPIAWVDDHDVRKLLLFILSRT